MIEPALIVLLSANPTFTKDIKPLVLKRCTPCHVGVIQTLPDFTIYENAFKYRTKIKDRVWDKRTMPPGGGSITEDERKMLKDWIEQGAKK